MRYARFSGWMFLGMITALSASAYGQDIEIQEGYVWDTSSGDVQGWAILSSDYSTGYYYNLQVISSLATWDGSDNFTNYELGSAQGSPSTEVDWEVSLDLDIIDIQSQNQFYANALY